MVELKNNSFCIQSFTHNDKRAESMPLKDIGISLIIIFPNLSQIPQSLIKKRIQM